MANWASSGHTTLFIKRVAFATPIVFTFHQVPGAPSPRCVATCSRCYELLSAICSA